MGMAAIGAEAPVAWLHRHSESGGDRLLADRQMAGSLDQVLQKQVVGTFLDGANLELAAVQGQPRRGCDLVTRSRPGRGRRLYFWQDHFLYCFEAIPRLHALARATAVPCRLSLAGCRAFDWPQKRTDALTVNHSGRLMRAMLNGAPTSAAVWKKVLYSVRVRLVTLADSFQRPYPIQADAFASW